MVIVLFVRLLSVTLLWFILHYNAIAVWLRLSLYVQVMLLFVCTNANDYNIKTLGEIFLRFACYFSLTTQIGERV